MLRASRDACEASVARGVGVYVSTGWKPGWGIPASTANLIARPRGCVPSDLSRTGVAVQQRHGGYCVVRGGGKPAARAGINTPVGVRSTVGISRGAALVLDGLPSAEREQVPGLAFGCQRLCIPALTANLHRSRTRGFTLEAGAAAAAWSGDRPLNGHAPQAEVDCEPRAYSGLPLRGMSGRCGGAKSKIKHAAGSRPARRIVE